jgi:hypothetical protein
MSGDHQKMGAVAMTITGDSVVPIADDADRGCVSKRTLSASVSCGSPLSTTSSRLDDVGSVQFNRVRHDRILDLEHVRVSSGN